MLRRKAKVQRKKHARRSGRALKPNGFGRQLHHERLEDRHLLALLGVGPLQLPIVSYDSGGNVSYNSTTDIFSLSATPLTINTSGNPQGFFFTGSVDIDIQVDSSGVLVGGVPGDDYVLRGDLDIDGDFVVDYFDINGPLLTAEISEFGHLDTGGSTDRYDFKLTITGGQLAGLFTGMDLGVVTTSESSTFVNDFNVNFGGNAKGELGAIEAQFAKLSGKKYDDRTGDGISGDDNPLANVVINLYQDLNTNGIMDPNEDDVVYATDTTDAGGQYSFSNLAPGAYIVQEVVPASYQPTSPTTLAVTLAPGADVTTGFDFANFKKGRITGTKFTDITGNSFSGDDTPLGGFTINLYQGTSTAGPLVASIFTAGDGTYSFEDVAIGTYFVQETVPSDYVQTGGNAGYVVVIGGTGLVSGSTSTGNDFDNFKKGRITGTKFTDITGDSFSGEDTPLGGITVNLYQGTSTAGPSVASTATAGDGTYSFDNLGPGTYFVQETLPSGYVQTGGNAGYVVVIGGSGIVSGGTSSGNNFDNFKKGKITGTKFTDITGNSFSGDDTPLGGITVNLYQGTSTAGPLVASTVTAGDGTYSFDNLGPGTYFVQETLPSGYVQTGGNSGYVVVIGGSGVASGGTSNGNNFDNFKKGRITGTKFTDITGNSFSSDDTPLGGITINLYQGNSTAGPLVASTATAGDGTYSFDNLGPGTYFVQETLPSGHVQTGGNSGYVVVIGGSGIVSGGTASGKNFDNFKKGKITGTKFTDITGNSFSSDDTPLGGITINLYQGNSTAGPLVASTSTAGDGTYSFDNLGPGTYFVQETLPSGYVQTGGNSGYVVVIGGSGIVSGGTASGKNFDNFKKGKITGTKFTDITGNSFSSDDTPLGGITINLYQGNSTAGPLVASTSTAGDGTYSFDNLGPGTYFVQETLPSGYVQTGGNSGYVVVIGGSGIVSGGTASGKNFDNFKKGRITGTKYKDLTSNSFSGDDTPLGGVTINLYQGTSTAGTLLASTVTAANGTYSFENLAPGTYFVQETLPGGYVQTGGTAGYVVTVGPGGVTSGGTAYGKDFDNAVKNPKIDIEKLTNGVDADTEANAPLIAPGATVTWTYIITNTGNVAYAKAQVVVTDDNGTPSNTADDFNPTFVASSDVGNDGILSPGEKWTYTASQVAQNLMSGASSTFNFAGNTALSGTAGNIRTFTSGGVSVKTSGFSRDSAGAWSTAYLGSYSGGLGVTDGSEGTGGNNSHTVDNVGRDNYVLFEFSETVIADSAFLGYVVGDSDLRVWIGTKTDPFNNHLTLSDALLTSLGFTELNETTLNTTRTADFNAGMLAGNVIVIAAKTGEATRDDYFKIEKMTVSAHACYENKAVVVVPGATDSDLSHYFNPPGSPGIDIEKYVNGYDADTEGEAVQIEAGDTVTWTYKVKNTGTLPFTSSQVVVTDDNGTPGVTSDDFSPTLVTSSDTGNDGILSPGETWTYTFSEPAQDLMSPGGATTFTMSGNTAVSGSAGNTMTFSADGISVKASAFSRDKSSGAWASAYLGAYSGGLGVTDTSENGSNNTHTADNIGRDNYVLFEFSEQVIVDSAFLGYVTTDSDLTVWIGSTTDPFNNHITLSDAMLTALGFTEVNLGDGSTRSADFNAGNRSGNVLVIAAKTGESSSAANDQFKINKLVTEQLEPGVYKNIAKVTASTVTDSDASYYKNPDCVDVSYSFAGSTSTSGTKGNVRTYTVNNVSVNVSAFSRTTATTGTWDTAYLGAYADGLGVTDTSEDGNNGTHRVDNVGRWNFVLFEFSTIVEVDRAFLAAVVGDSDASVFIGTANNPFHNHLTLNDSLTSIMTYAADSNTDSTGDRWADFNPGGVKGNVLVIAASVSDTSSNDQFKISKLDVCAEYVKFYVVDPNVDKTYEYGTTGQALANYKVNSANTNSRGVASTPNGDKLWIIDGNKTVYVYDVDGKLLGSWIPKDSSGNALSAPEDITISGSDIWIVDDGLNKVFKYSGAATRTSGSQNAASSFALNSSNADAKGLVTNGTYIWVVNDAASGADKVFKYNTSGTLQGSWTIDAANSKPTGITIDPTNVDHIWIVDSGKASVYRYNSGASRTSGTYSANSVFALSSSNTNAQGIADPPPVWGSVDVVKSDTSSFARLPVAAQITDQALDNWASSPISSVQFKESASGPVKARHRQVSRESSLPSTASLVATSISDARRKRRDEWFDSAATDSTFDAFDRAASQFEMLERLAENVCLNSPNFGTTVGKR